MSLYAPGGYCCGKLLAALTWTYGPFRIGYGPKGKLLSHNSPAVEMVRDSHRLAHDWRHSTFISRDSRGQAGPKQHCRDRHRLSAASCLPADSTSPPPLTPCQARAR
eukprot:3526906-Pleurochrysis_carterae.AAC.2